MMMCSMTSAILFYEPFDSKLNLNETIELDTNPFDADGNKLISNYGGTLLWNESNVKEINHV